MSALFTSSRFWIRTASLVVAVSVALALAHLTWRLVGWDDGRRTIATPEQLSPVGGGAASGLASILALAPFGSAPVDASGLPQTSLALELNGVIYAAASSVSTALISVSGAAPQSFSVGQAPMGNATIEAIEMDRVVLNVGGRREALSFPRVSVTAAAAATASAPSSLSPPQISPEATSALASASPIATALAARNGAAGSTAPQAPRPAAAAANPAAALAAAGVSATNEGYRVGPDAPQQLLRAGLRPGDLVRTLNGQPVGDLQSDQQLFERAAAAGSARVEVVRDGRTLTLTFPLR